MKVLTSEQVRSADQYTIKNEPIASIDLMERASMMFVSEFTEYYHVGKAVYVFCGVGNNGGDGLAIARLLSERDYDVHVYVIGDTNKGSPDFKENLIRVKIDVNNIFHDDQFPELSDAVIIDAIFGSGLSRELEGIYASLVDHLNALDCVRVSVDIPSGLFAEKNSTGKIFKAACTIAFQIPKLAFFLPQNYRYVGDWSLVDIGLSDGFLQNVESNVHYLNKDQVSRRILKRDKFDHKGTFGKALIVAGSSGKMGAAVLAGTGALRSGLGLLTLHIPEAGNHIVQTALPEAMVVLDRGEAVSHIESSGYRAIGIGPGIGRSKVTVQALAEFLKGYRGPLVMDADALNILSEHRELLQLLPKQTILTPHPKEFERLTGPWKNDFERLEKQKQLAKELQAIVVLKGAHTSIISPDGTVFFNSTGNPGMATAGSGDVLTGVITGLLGNGYQALDAALVGVYMHGLAGDLAASEIGMTSMIARDLLEHLPKAFQKFDK